MLETGEYISRDAIYAEIKRDIETYWTAAGGGYYLAEDALPEIENFPAADVVPVVHAKWVRKYNVFRSEYDGSIIEGYDPACSACDSWSPGLGKYKFCPYCGARMDLEESE